MARLNYAAIVCVVVAMGSGSVAQAQVYPAKPVRLVVPYAAGTTADLVPRQMIPRLAELLGKLYEA